jgi:hypothetical protein
MSIYFILILYLKHNGMSSTKIGNSIQVLAMGLY